MKSLIFTILAIITSVCLSSCGNKAAQNVENGVKDTGKAVVNTAEKIGDTVNTAMIAVTDEFKDIEKDAVNMFDSAEDIAEDDIHTAINYINENVDNVNNDPETAKQFAHHAAYLKHASNGVNHEISDYASKAYTYAQHIYASDKNAVKDAIGSAGDELKSAGSAIKNEQDKLVSEFKGMLNKK